MAAEADVDRNGRGKRPQEHFPDVVLQNALPHRRVSGNQVVCVMGYFVGILTGIPSDKIINFADMYITCGKKGLRCILSAISNLITYNCLIKPASSHCIQDPVN